MRRPALAATVTVAPAPLTPLVAPAFLAIAEFAAVAVLVASLALVAIARPPIAVPTPVLVTFACRCCIGGNRTFRRLIGAAFAKIAVTVAPPVPMAFPPGALAGLTGCGLSARGRRRYTIGGAFVAAMSLAIVTRRTPLVGTATGTPDLDEFRLGR